MNQTELLTLVAGVDPLRDAPTDDATSIRHLAAARSVLELRTQALAATVLVGRTTWRRRLSFVAAAAVLLPAVAVAVPALLERDELGGPLVGTASASEAGLECGSAYLRAIRPDAASVRPWPSVLPAGWSVREAFARASEGSTWCLTPSLTAAELSPDGTVLGTVKVTGPAQDIEVYASERLTDDRVGPYDAVRLEGSSPGPDDYSTWIVTDATGAQWYATVDGYPADTARDLLAALTLDGRNASWDVATSPQLQVLHQRTGAPYPERATGEDWYLRLDGAGVERTIEARTRDRSDVPVVSDVTAGSRLITVAGRPAYLFQDRGRPVSVVADLRPGTTVFAEVRGDLPDTLRMLESLTDLPQDDPRLDDLALDEEYEG